MKLIDFINEEWADSTKKNDKTFEIFKNPTRKEINQFNNIRFLIDINNKAVYIWNADLLHGATSRILKKPYDLSGIENYFYGVGRIVGNKIIGIQTGTAKIKDIEYVNSPEAQEWLKKYFTGNPSKKWDD
jgi:hypothetical protein